MFFLASREMCLSLEMIVCDLFRIKTNRRGASRNGYKYYKRRINKNIQGQF